MTLFLSASGEEVFADDEECVRRIDWSETKLDASNIRLVYDSLVRRRGFSGSEELLFNMYELLKILMMGYMRWL